MTRKIALAALLGALALDTLAAPAGEVLGLQSPAWLERDGRRQPLAPLAALESGDRVVTGAGARALLRLAEGSFVKLGENAAFHIASLEAESASGFRGALDVLEGAFRFTTTKLSARFSRNLDIRVAAVTAGIRGTDVWGKAASDRDIVCLIEGAITVQRGADAPVEMNDPLSFYIAPKDRPALPVGPVDPEKLRKWAEETELVERGGILRGAGRYVVHLSSHRDPARAEAERERLAAAGYPVAVGRAEVDGSAWYRVSLAGFEQAVEAAAFAVRAARDLGAESAWVGPGG